MKRQGVVDRRADSLGLEMRLQIVAPLRANGVLVEDGLVLRIDRGRTDTLDARQRLGVVFRVLPALRAPFCEVRKLCTQYCSLKGVKTAVIPYLVVEVLLRPTMDAQAS